MNEKFVCVCEGERECVFERKREKEKNNRLWPTTESINDPWKKENGQRILVKSKQMNMTSQQSALKASDSFIITE